MGDARSAARRKRGTKFVSFPLRTILIATCPRYSPSHVLRGTRRPYPDRFAEPVAPIRLPSIRFQALCVEICQELFGL